MNNELIKKYKTLYNLCKRHSPIQLKSEENNGSYLLNCKAKETLPQKNYVKNGFISKFCISQRTK